MQINKINSKFTQKVEKRNNNNQAFKGGLTSGVDAFCAATANAIENGGLFVSFTLQDMLGTNLPRPIMGLLRNRKENNGQKNTKFAAKEFVREFTTGPSMFIIPAGMLAIGKKAFGKTINTPMKFIKSFGEIHAKSPLNAAGKALNKQEFFTNAFTEILKNAKNEEAASEGTIKKAGEFAQKLAENLKDKNACKNTINTLSEEFVKISKNHAVNPAEVNFTVAKAGKTTSAPFKKTVDYMISYADDIVEKVAKEADASKLTQKITKLTQNKVVGRMAMNVAMYAAIMSFLKIVPKLYNKAEGTENAGLKGLMTEETLKNPDNKDVKEETKETQNTKDNSKPSFGSLASVSKALTADNIGGKVLRAFEFDGLNLSFPLLVSVMSLGAVLPRIINAKDKYDREEIIRRDATTCALMLFGEKAMRKCFAKASEKSTGLVLAAKPQNFDSQNTAKKIFDYIRPIHGVNNLSTAEMKSIYTNIGDYKEGLAGFCKYIDGQKGNLSKLFGLTEESKTIVGDLLKAEGKELAKADNKTITEVIAKNADSDAVKKLTGMFFSPKEVAKEKGALKKGIEKLASKEIFKNTKTVYNPWHDAAKKFNDKFTTFSVVLLVPLLLGFALPYINEKATKKRVKKENELKQQNQTNNLANITSKLFANDEKATKIFGDMNTFQHKK